MIVLSVLKELTQLTHTYLPTIRIQDIFEILLLVFFIYKLIVGLKGTRAMVVLKGVIILFIFYNIVYILHFEAILVLLQSIMALLIFALIMVFQPEMRKFLEQIGTQNLTEKVVGLSIFKKKKEPYKYYSDKDISELSKACFAMGEVKTGALIVIQREIPLTDIIETGIKLNADITSQLLINTFEKNTPLHDGAVVQVKSKLIAATCYLPLSQNPKINKKLGTRHRAAIGISEVTDCVVIVVSEETGGVSIVVNGEIQGGLTKEKFTELLFKYQSRKELSVGFDRKKIQEKKSLKWFLSEYNILDRLVSLLIGFAAWVLLINIANPITTVTFEDVPIEFLNTSIIEATGKTYELKSNGLSDVKVTDKRTVVDSLTKDDIHIVADFSKLSYVNAVPLEGSIVGNNSAVISFITDDTIIVELDSIISKEFDIVIETFSEEDSTYYVPNLEISTQHIVLTGGKTKIDLVDKVVCTFDITSNSEDYSSSAIPVVYDRNGDIIENNNFVFSEDLIEAKGYGYPIKTVPLNIQVGEDVLMGYMISDVKYDLTSIRIASDADYLQSFNEITIPIDLNISADNLLNDQYIKSATISDSLPEGVYLADMHDIVNVTFTFEQMKTKKITFTDSEISLRGDVASDVPVVIEFVDKAFTIEVSGKESILNRLNKDVITPYIDITGLSKGTYNLIVQFDGLDNVVLTSNVSVKLHIDESEL